MSGGFAAFLVVLTAMGCPTWLLSTYLRQRHELKMKALETQGTAKHVAELEARVRTLETIATGGAHDLEARLRQLADSDEKALPAHER